MGCPGEGKFTMTEVYVHHRIACAPRAWSPTAERMAAESATRLGSVGGALYGLWRSQIGLPRDTVTAITVWRDMDSAIRFADLLHEGLETVESVELDVMTPTLRPGDASPPTRQGNYAFRWFETPEAHFAEFLELCAGAWPGFESAYDSQVIGLWQVEDAGPLVRSLLLTRRPDLAMWERSKLPANAEEAEVRRKLSRRYDLCDWTMVSTTTLITAEDSKDEARWA